MSRHVTVIGGGPAGMVAALFAAQQGAAVELLERNEKLGKKLYITGKGRCNLTNTAENLMASIPRNPRFLFAAFSHFSAPDIRALLQAHGCPTKEERGGRVFPVSEKASDVTKALHGAMQSAGVRVRLNTHVPDLSSLLARGPVIVATGGISYPGTGSTGDGYAFAESAGHTIVPAAPSLVPVVTADEWPARLAGLSLKNVRLSARQGKKVIFDELGEMLFTHFGISGPLVLSISSSLRADMLGSLDIRLDMKPGLSLDQLESRLSRDFESSSRKRLQTVLPQLLPARMATEIPALAAIEADKQCNQITRAERARLAALLKAIPIRAQGLRPIEEAIITRGGVSVKEVNPATMESKLCPGLFFAGEVLDVDALTGGFNLQIAFSTGALAGKSAGILAISTND